MTTPLEKPLRRAVLIDREPWVVTISPSGLKLTRKGGRKGPELAWQAIVNGDAALAAALNASIRKAPRRTRPARAAIEDSRYVQRRRGRSRTGRR